MRPSTVLFGSRMLEKLTWKAGLEVCEWLLHRVFNSGKRNLLLRQSLPVCKCNIGFV